MYAPGRVVFPFGELGEIGDGLLPRLIISGLGLLDLQGGEEALNEGIIPAVAFAASSMAPCPPLQSVSLGFREAL